MYVYYDRCEHLPEKPTSKPLQLVLNSVRSYQQNGFWCSNNPIAREYAYLGSLKKRGIRTSTSTDEGGRSLSSVFLALLNYVIMIC